MKTIVFAYHNLGVIGITKLLAHGYTIPLVFTHEDNPHENVWFGSVKELCTRLSLDFVTPVDPNTAAGIERIMGIAPDIIFSFYYRFMISKDILSIPPYGAYNLHGSLLPKYRGRCPVNWVIIKGEKETGITLHEMVEKPDAGAIVAQRRIVIEGADTALTLFHKIEAEAEKLLDECLPEMYTGIIRKVSQDLSKGSYYGGRKPEDGRIAWHRSAREIYNLIRGVTRPYPGAFGHLEGQKILFWWAVPQEGPDKVPGTISVVDDRAMIGTGDGVLLPLEIEVNGRVLKDKDLLSFFKKHEGEGLQ